MLRSATLSCLLPQEQVQLGGVFLHMAHGVQQQLPEGQLSPGKGAYAGSLLGGERLDRFLQPNLADPRSAVWLELQEAHRHQFPDGLAYGDSTNAKLLRKPSLEDVYIHLTGRGLRE